MRVLHAALWALAFAAAAFGAVADSDSKPPGSPPDSAPTVWDGAAWLAKTIVQVLYLHCAVLYHLGQAIAAGSAVSIEAFGWLAGLVALLTALFWVAHAYGGVWQTQLLHAMGAGFRTAGVIRHLVLVPHGPKISAAITVLASSFAFDSYLSTTKQYPAEAVAQERLRTSLGFAARPGQLSSPEPSELPFAVILVVLLAAYTVIPVLRAPPAAVSASAGPAAKGAAEGDTPAPLAAAPAAPLPSAPAPREVTDADVPRRDSRAVESAKRSRLPKPVQRTQTILSLFGGLAPWRMSAPAGVDALVVVLCRAAVAAAVVTLIDVAPAAAEDITALLASMASLLALVAVGEGIHSLTASPELRAVAAVAPAVVTGVCRLYPPLVAVGLSFWDVLLVSPYVVMWVVFLAVVPQQLSAAKSAYVSGMSIEGPPARQVVVRALVSLLGEVAICFASVTVGNAAVAALLSDDGPLTPLYVAVSLPSVEGQAGRSATAHMVHRILPWWAGLGFTALCIGLIVLILAAYSEYMEVVAKSMPSPGFSPGVPTLERVSPVFLVRVSRDGTRSAREVLSSKTMADIAAAFRADASGWFEKASETVGRAAEMLSSLLQQRGTPSGGAPARAGHAEAGLAGQAVKPPEAAAPAVAGAAEAAAADPLQRSAASDTAAASVVPSAQPPVEPEHDAISDHGEDDHGDDAGDWFSRFASFAGDVFTADSAGSGRLSSLIDILSDEAGAEDDCLLSFDVILTGRITVPLGMVVRLPGFTLRCNGLHPVTGDEERMMAALWDLFSLSDDGAPEGLVCRVSSIGQERVGQLLEDIARTEAAAEAGDAPDAAMVHWTDAQLGSKCGPAGGAFLQTDETASSTTDTEGYTVSHHPYNVGLRVEISLKGLRRSVASTELGGRVEAGQRKLFSMLMQSSSAAFDYASSLGNQLLGTGPRAAEGAGPAPAEAVEADVERQRGFDERRFDGVSVRLTASTSFGADDTFTMGLVHSRQGEAVERQQSQMLEAVMLHLPHLIEACHQGVDEGDGTALQDTHSALQAHRRELDEQAEHIRSRTGVWARSGAQEIGADEVKVKATSHATGRLVNAMERFIKEWKAVAAARQLAMDQIMGFGREDDHTRAPRAELLAQARSSAELLVQKACSLQLLFSGVCAGVRELRAAVLSLPVSRLGPCRERVMRTHDDAAQRSVRWDRVLRGVWAETTLVLAWSAGGVVSVAGADAASQWRKAMTRAGLFGGLLVLSSLAEQGVDSVRLMPRAWWEEQRRRQRRDESKALLGGQAEGSAADDGGVAASPAADDLATAGRRPSWEDPVAGADDGKASACQARAGFPLPPVASGQEQNPPQGGMVAVSAAEAGFPVAPAAGASAEPRSASGGPILLAEHLTPEVAAELAAELVKPGLLRTGGLSDAARAFTASGRSSWLHGLMQHKSRVSGELLRTARRLGETSVLVREVRRGGAVEWPDDCHVKAEAMERVVEAIDFVRVFASGDRPPCSRDDWLAVERALEAAGDAASGTELARAALGPDAGLLRGVTSWLRMVTADTAQGEAAELLAKARAEVGSLEL